MIGRHFVYTLQFSELAAKLRARPGLASSLPVARLTYSMICKPAIAESLPVGHEPSASSADWHIASACQLATPVRAASGKLSARQIRTMSAPSREQALGASRAGLKPIWLDNPRRGDSGGEDGNKRSIERRGHKQTDRRLQ
jgi:hypothetical protein